MFFSALSNSFRQSLSSGVMEMFKSVSPVLDSVSGSSISEKSLVASAELSSGTLRRLLSLASWKLGLLMIFPTAVPVSLIFPFCPLLDFLAECCSWLDTVSRDPLLFKVEAFFLSRSFTLVSNSLSSQWLSSSIPEGCGSVSAPPDDTAALGVDVDLSMGLGSSKSKEGHSSGVLGGGGGGKSKCTRLGVSPSCGVSMFTWPSLLPAEEWVFRMDSGTGCVLFAACLNSSWLLELAMECRGPSWDFEDAPASLCCCFAVLVLSGSSTNTFPNSNRRALSEGSGLSNLKEKCSADWPCLSFDFSGSVLMWNVGPLALLSGLPLRLCASAALLSGPASFCCNSSMYASLLSSALVSWRISFSCSETFVSRVATV